MSVVTPGREYSALDITTLWENGDVMRLEVDLDRCTGHGICESIADDVFEVQDDGVVLIHHDRATESGRDRLQQAVIQCPAAALPLME